MSKKIKESQEFEMKGKVLGILLFLALTVSSVVLFLGMFATFLGLLSEVSAVTGKNTVPIKIPIQQQEMMVFPFNH